MDAAAFRILCFMVIMALLILSAARPSQHTLAQFSSQYQEQELYERALSVRCVFILSLAILFWTITQVIMVYT